MIVKIDERTAFIYCDDCRRSLARISLDDSKKLQETRVTCNSDIFGIEEYRNISIGGDQ